MTPRTRSGQQSYSTAWQSHVRVRPRASAAVTSSAMIRCRSAHCIFIAPQPSRPVLATSVARRCCASLRISRRSYLRESPDVSRLVHRRVQPHVHDFERVLQSESASIPGSARSRRCAAARIAPSSGHGIRRRERPSILFAAIADPMPAPSMTMPASASPRATDFATRAAVSG